MSRAKWKSPYICTKYIERTKLLTDLIKEKKSIISRNSQILPAFIGLTFYVHNGKNYSEIVVNETMVGHKFGEFSFTRSKFVFKKKKKGK